MRRIDVVINYPIDEDDGIWWVKEGCAVPVGSGVEYNWNWGHSDIDYQLDCGHKYSNYPPYLFDLFRSLPVPSKLVMHLTDEGKLI